MDTATISRSEAIARLNDRCRLGFDRTAKIVITRTAMATIGGDAAASQIMAQARVMQQLRRHAFADGDKELRDRGSFEIECTEIYFMIDAYDLALEWGSENPADASVTRRVLTVMLREDL